MWACSKSVLKPHSQKKNHLGVFKSFKHQAIQPLLLSIPAFSFAVFVLSVKFANLFLHISSRFFSTSFGWGDYILPVVICISNIEILWFCVSKFLLNVNILVYIVLSVNRRSLHLFFLLLHLTTIEKLSAWLYDVISMLIPFFCKIGAFQQICEPEIKHQRKWLLIVMYLGSLHSGEELWSQVEVRFAFAFRWSVWMCVCVCMGVCECTYEWEKRERKESIRGSAI